MKRWIALMLALVICVASCGCMNKAKKEALTNRHENEVDPVVVDGEEVPIKDYLIEHLKTYIQTEEFKTREQAYIDYGGENPVEFTVTNVIEIQLDDIGETRFSVHFIAIRADTTWGEDGVKYENNIFVIDYVSGKMYSQFDEIAKARPKNQESIEWEIHVALNSGLRSMDFVEDDAILSQRETQNVLSADEIAEINAALHS